LTLIFDLERAKIDDVIDSTQFGGGQILGRVFHYSNVEPTEEYTIQSY